MVTASVYRATDDIGKMFEKRDITGIAIAAGLAGVGFAVAASIGSFVLDTLGVSQMNTVNTAIAAVGAMVGSVLLVRFLGAGIGGSLAVGALGWVGLLLLSTLFGDMEAVNAVNRTIAIGGGGGSREVRRVPSEAPVSALPSVTGNPGRPAGKLGV